MKIGIIADTHDDIDNLKAALATLQTEGVTIHGTMNLEHRLPVISFTVEGYDPSDVGTLLDVDHNIATRTGLQCAPLVHDQMGTSPRGTVRMSVGPMNEASHIEAAIRGVQDIAASAPRG